MKIEESNKLNVQAGKVGFAQGMDSESKNFQNQIANAQNRLQELSANTEMSAEEKAEKRQEIQKQITELNNQLRQHQIELRREQQQAKDNNLEDVLGGNQDEQSKKDNTTGISQGGMRAIISADSAVSQAKAQGSVATAMESRVRVLQGEIKQDAGRGRGTESKQKELESLEKKADRVKGAQMGILSDAVQEMQKAVEKENQKEKKSSEESKRVSDNPVIAVNAAPKNKENRYIKGTMYSSVDIHI